MSIDQIRTVAIIGAGTMGQGIAQVCATAGFHVLLYDVRAGASEKAVQEIHKSLTSLLEKGKISAQQFDRAKGGLATASSKADLRADIVIEAVTEKLEAKVEIFAALEAISPEHTIFATNTSSIPVAQIAASLKDPGRLAGLHFFNPASVMKLVEVVRGSRTRPAIIDSLFAWTRKLGKEPVLAQDSPGFIVNRVARHFYVESLQVLGENVAAHETIDALLRSAGFRMGPFELMDLIGVDVNFAVTKSMYDSFHQAPRFRPSRIQQQKVDAGHHGRKTGKGFYDYT